MGAAGPLVCRKTGPTQVYIIVDYVNPSVVFCEGAKAGDGQGKVR